MTALQRVRASLAAGERPSDDDVRAVCADAERYAWLREGHKGCYNNVMIYAESALDAAIDAAIREPK